MTNGLAAETYRARRFIISSFNYLVTFDRVLHAQSIAQTEQCSGFRSTCCCAAPLSFQGAARDRKRPKIRL